MRKVRQFLVPSLAYVLVAILAIPACKSGLEYNNPYGVSSVTLQEPAPVEDLTESHPGKATLLPDSDDGKRPYPDSRFAIIDGARIHFRWIPGRGGTGRYILIHGFAASTYSYRHTIQHLKAQGHEIIAVDLPGYGFSDRVLEGSHSKFRRAQIIWNLVSLLESVESEKNSSSDTTLTQRPGSRRWVLIGHSMGGSVIASMAQMHPENVEYLVYIAGSVDGGPGWFTRAAISWIPGLKSLVAWYAERYSFNADSFQDLLSSAYARKPTDQEVQGYLKPFLVPDTASSILASIENSGDERSLELDESHIPALLIWGLKDEWVEPGVGKTLHRDLNISLLYTIEDAGHCPMETHPATVNKIIDENDSVLRQLRTIQSD
ncbi:MAG TPA: hypothetical protein DEA96_11955 [Leptospiraceae bacterium]|nr:hypothetical protein [Spirochaetaceae bacterium]HBS05673.1 hypothetical protein [Leptospiraceae bacterium]|tara:strand:+ start:36253 stop:37380 length:1128 start_codon:yes stop_codon:yes gene_type:complete